MSENSYTGFRIIRETRCRIVLIGPVELGPRTQGHHMETMTEFEADAIGAAMQRLTEVLDVIA